MAVERKGLTQLEETTTGDESDTDFDTESSELDSESDEEVKLTEPSKTATYNAEGILDKLEDISWPEDVEWFHKLSVEVERGEQEVDVNDDLTRELAFYNQAVEGTRLAFGKLESMGLPFLRPADYYAEMVKTDSHMEKVKGRLLAEKRRIEEAEERRKARDAKRLAKEVQAQKQRERTKQKKAEIESVKKWRKQRQQSGFSKGDDGGGAAEEMDFGFGEGGKGFERPGGKKRPGVAPWDRSGGKKRMMSGGGSEAKRKRERKDDKFGSGGRKGLRKQNTAETTNDVQSFGKNKFIGNKKRKM